MRELLVLNQTNWYHPKPRDSTFGIDTSVFLLPG